MHPPPSSMAPAAQRKPGANDYPSIGEGGAPSGPSADFRSIGELPCGRSQAWETFGCADSLQEIVMGAQDGLRCETNSLSPRSGERVSERGASEIRDRLQAMFSRLTPPRSSLAWRGRRFTLAASPNSMAVVPARPAELPYDWVGAHGSTPAWIGEAPRRLSAPIVRPSCRTDEPARRKDRGVRGRQSAA